VLRVVLRREISKERTEILQARQHPKCRE
jgi:hypothetical protein